MTRIDFHVLPDGNQRQHDVYLCRLVERLWQDGRQVHLACEDATRLGALDALLWTFNDTSFVPHAPSGAPEAGDVRVTLGLGEQAPSSADVLVNLKVDVPPCFSQFEQVIETTGPNEAARAEARLRFRFYKDRGYPIDTVKS